jgi:DNA-binding NarL/FixJ family response regulator
LHGKKVLIVEDGFLTAEGLSHTIADYGFTVVGPVDTADRAVRLIGQQPPDGALLDVRLRDGSAVEVAKVLQERGVPEWSKERTGAMLGLCQGSQASSIG